MEPEAEKLIQESINVNYVDAEQYPSSTEIQNRWVSYCPLTICYDPKRVTPIIQSIIQCMHTVPAEMLVGILTRSEISVPTLISEKESKHYFMYCA